MNKNYINHYYIIMNQNICILLPTKFETKEIENYLECNVKCEVFDDDFLNSFKCDEYEDDVFAHLKKEIFRTIEVTTKEKIIVIISDYMTASLLENYKIFLYIPSKEYIETTITRRNDWCDILNRINDIVYPFNRINYRYTFEYNSLNMLLKRITNDVISHINYII